jgi:hypothetical protein
MMRKSNHHKSWLVGMLAAGVAVIAPVAGAGAKSGASSNHGLRSFHGRVASVSTADKTFQIRRAGGGTLTFRVTSTTVFQRLGGRLAALRENRAIEVKAKRVDGRWIARKVERDDAAADDRGDDGAGHDVGDDHGGAGSGADDGAGHDVGDDHGSDG